MMKEVKQKLTLYRPATCRIKVPGELDECWSELDGMMTIAIESEGKSPSVTTLTGTVDQAALHSVHNCIRDMNAPLLSVQLVGSETDNGENNL